MKEIPVIFKRYPHDTMPEMWKFPGCEINDVTGKDYYLFRIIVALFGSLTYATPSVLKPSSIE